MDSVALGFNTSALSYGTAIGYCVNAKENEISLGSDKSVSMSIANIPILYIRSVCTICKESRQYVMVNGSNNICIDCINGCGEFNAICDGCDTQRKYVMKDSVGNKICADCMFNAVSFFKHVMKAPPESKNESLNS
jgi:hypothetical protein